MLDLGAGRPFFGSSNTTQHHSASVVLDSPVQGNRVCCVVLDEKQPWAPKSSSPLPYASPPTPAPFPESAVVFVPAWSFLPFFLPSSLPSFLPSSLPSFLPSFLPSLHPSFLPSYLPSFLPSFLLSFLPSCLPSFLPSFLPSVRPSFLPSFLSSLRSCFIPSCVSLPAFVLPSFLRLLLCSRLPVVSCGLSFPALWARPLCEAFTKIGAHRANTELLNPP